MPPSAPSHLDAELAWGKERTPDPEVVLASGRGGVSWRHLLIAALADAGVILLAVGLAWVVAAAAGASLTPPQIVLGVVVGALALAPVAVACLWAWRGTPGMLLLNACWRRPLPLARALGVACVWFVALPLLALPLMVRWRGANLLERLAGSRLSFRSDHAAA